MTDDMLRGARRPNKGGVVQVNFYSAFVSEEWRKAWEAQKPEARGSGAGCRGRRRRRKASHGPTARKMRWTRQFAAKIPRPPLCELIDHIDHMVKVAGIDHVGIGSDFDGIPSAPRASIPRRTCRRSRRR